VEQRQQNGQEVLSQPLVRSNPTADAGCNLRPWTLRALFRSHEMAAQAAPNRPRPANQNLRLRSLPAQ